MLKNILRDCHWERHGDYWILHDDESGKPVGILIQLEETKEEEMGKLGQQHATTIRRTGS